MSGKPANLDPPPIAPRSFAASMAMHGTLIAAIVALGWGVAPKTAWSGTVTVPSSPSLWRETQEPVEPPATATPPPVHAEQPPPPRTLLTDPVLPEFEPTPNSEELAAQERAESAQDAPEPDWSARVAVKPRRDNATPQPPAEPASPPAADGALVQPSPIAGKNPPPEYPRAAKKRGIEGEVTVLLEITTEGKVDAAHVEKSSGSSLLDDAALQQLSQWAFEPARRGGVAVRGVHRQIVEFSLQQRD